MEKDISYERFLEEQSKAKREYIDYLKNRSVFGNIYESLLTRIELPKNIIRPTIDTLEIIKNNVKNNTHAFLNGVNLDIKWLEEKRVDELECLAIDAHKNIMKEANTGLVFDIPLMPSDSFSSYVLYYMGDYEYFKDTIFMSINIKMQQDAGTVESSYFHELGHALISRNWYMLNNPLFDEYVPHLLEMIYNCHILKDNEGYVKKIVPEINMATCNCSLYSYEGILNNENDLTYILALVLASITFEKFIDFRESEKLEMEQDIRKMLNGDVTVERFMGKYDINLDNDSSIKYYKRTVERVRSYSFN